VQSGNVEPEKARTWEVGTRYDDGALTAEMGLFLINFNNQYDSNQTNDTVTARGKTRHSGLEAQARYDLGELSPALDNLSSTPAMRMSTLKSARKATPTATRCPSRRNTKAPLASITSPAAGRSTSTATSSPASLRITPIPLPSADGSTGRIPGYMLWGARVAYDFGPQMANLNLALGVKNIFDHAYYTRSYDDNNKGFTPVSRARCTCKDR
jgi:Fe(3+) dicitrate transport protein